MKLLVLIVTIFAWTSVSAEYKSIKASRNEHVVGSNIQSGTFVTRVDHFRPQDPRTVEMQYHANLNNYLQDGPIYIYIKHITDNSTRWIEEGLMVDIARSNAAALFTFDQRYFGINLMFDEFLWDNLRYLTIEQTLADISTFIDHTRQSLGTPFAPVILWGSQFGATLAGKVVYHFYIPIIALQKTLGVWSSSGIFEINYYTSAYYNLIAYSLAHSSSLCRYRVQYAFDDVEYMISNNQTEVQYALNLCDPVDKSSPYDVAMLFERLIDMITQYIDLFHFHGVQTFCHHISSTSLTPLESLIRWAKFVYATEDGCFDFAYKNAVDRYSDTREPRMAWYYLQCTQAGIFRVTDQFNWLTRRIDLGYHLVLCRDVLGDQYNSINFMNSIAQLQLQFSGFYESVSNMVYTNGLIDPWLNDGITSVQSENVTVINIEYYSRSADLTSLNGWDSYQLTLAKREIREIINNWSRN